MTKPEAENGKANEHTPVSENAAGSERHPVKPSTAKTRLLAGGEAMKRPLVIDLCAGLGGWTRGFLAEGYDAVGFDIEWHVYGDKKYPAQLVLQDITTLHGSQFRHAAVIVASPPCQAYSYRAMPWKRAKALGPPDNTLFETCFRIAREAGVPIVVENVKGAQKWVGRAAWHYGSYYLWGDVPALMPSTRQLKIVGYSDPRRNGGRGVHLTSQRENDAGVKNDGGSWFAVAHNTESGHCRNPVNAGGIKQPGHSGRAWFADPDVAGHFSSKSDSRKAASAMIAEIPFDLAQWIARCYFPDAVQRREATIGPRRLPLALMHTTGWR